MSARPFSRSDTTKICFLLEHDALFSGVFYLYIYQAQKYDLFEAQKYDLFVAEIGDNISI